MTILARMLPWRDARRPPTSMLLLSTLTAFCLSLAVLCASAGARVSEAVPGTTVGLQPRSTVLHEGVGTEPKRFANASGAPVLPSNKTYAIYWDPTDNYHGDWQALIDTFFHNMGAASGSLASVFAVDAQYTDAANRHAAYKSTFMGAYTDTDPYPAVGNCTDPHPLEGTSYPWEEPDAITCITNAQIEEELKLFIAGRGLQKGMGTIFYMLTPPGVTVCLDETGGHCSDYEGLPGETSYENSFCSYHADINPDSAPNGDSNTILYATVPWIAGGFGDGHLAQVDRTTGYDCQDGGFDPSSKPIEEKEHKKTHTPLEEEEFAKKNAKEKREQQEAEELELEKPHQQEPNQQPCPPPTPDGFCDTGLADLIVNQIAVEQQNIVTDPLLDSWQDPSGNEATDECRDFFAIVLGGSVTASPETFAGTLFNQSLAAGNYYLNDAFNLASLKLPYPGIPCLPGIRLEPHFTAPNRVNSGEVVGFDGMESDITLNEGTRYAGTTPKETYATYTWNFGDGTPTVTGFAPGAPSLNSPETSCPTWLTPCAASTYHSYKYGGTYSATLTVTDTGGNVASVTEPITVVGPPPPTPSGPGAGGAGSSAAGASSSSGTSAKPAVPGPVATQSVLSSSLSRTLRRGLVVRYSVNQQATGHFEVLLAASIAHRLGLHPPLALGLPAGTPPQVVIAKALLVSNGAGRNTLRIQFGKITAQRLRRLHRVSLLLRLNLRNAGGGTTTVLSKLTLH